MRLDTEWVEFETAGKTCSADCARPSAAGGQVPGILVVQEVWGVDEHIQDLAERYATAGYVALAPELYSLGERPEELAPARIAAVKAFLETVPPPVWTDSEERSRAVDRLPDGEREQITGSMARLFGPRDWEGQLQALGDGVRALHDDPACNGLIGAVGWCMGGAFSGRLAAREGGLAAAAIFYGAPPSAEEAAAITCPVMGFYGGDDARITEAVPDFAEVMKRGRAGFEYHVYPNAPHAFFNDTRRSYRVDAARDAWARCLTFFASHLGPVTG